MCHILTFTRKGCYTREVMSLFCFNILRFISHLYHICGCFVWRHEKTCYERNSRTSWERYISWRNSYTFPTSTEESTRSQKYESLKVAKVPVKRNQFREGSVNQKIFLRRSPTEICLFRSLLMSVLSFHLMTENQNGPITRIVKISSATSVFYVKKSS